MASETTACGAGAAQGTSDEEAPTRKPVAKPRVLREWPDEGTGRAYEWCLQRAASHYENFPTASNLLLGKDLARPVAALYAFSRQADDFADEAEFAPAENRLRLLDEWEQHLDRALAGEPHHPAFVALADTIARYRIEPDLFRALLSAFRQDVRKSRYESVAEMLDYCTRSANPVGRVVLRLHGFNAPVLDDMSDAICTALQLINFWQDVAIDLEKDRIYLPQDEMKKHGVTEAQLKAAQVDENYRALLKQECDRARTLLEKGTSLPEYVGGRLALWLRAVWLGGERILSGIEAAGYDSFRRRPTLSGWDKASIGVRALLSWPRTPKLLAAAGGGAH